MNVVECTAYGSSDVLRVRQRPVPVPSAHEVLVRVRATTVTSGDWRIRSLQMPPGFGALARPIFGFSRPRQPVLGSEAAGEVVRVGHAVTDFQVGDRVVLFDGAKMGCHAEFKCVHTARCLVKLPDSIDDVTAAALPFGGTTALHFLRATGLAKGERVLVIGASGSVGSAVVQLAKDCGAFVSAVCSGINAGWIRDLGADEVIDYQTTDVAALEAQFDLVFETVGALNLAHAMRLTRDGGRVALIAGGLGDMLRSVFTGHPRRIKVAAGPAEERSDDLQKLVERTVQGAFRPVIDSVVPFAEIARAHDRVGSLRKRGSIVLTLEACPDPTRGPAYRPPPIVD